MQRSSMLMVAALLLLAAGCAPSTEAGTADANEEGADSGADSSLPDPVGTDAGTVLVDGGVTLTGPADAGRPQADAGDDLTSSCVCTCSDDSCAIDAYGACDDGDSCEPAVPQPPSSSTCDALPDVLGNSSPGECTTTWQRQGPSTPLGMAVDSSFVYWTDETIGVVMRAPLAGGAAVTLAVGQGNAGPLTLAQGYLYWVQSDFGHIVRMPVNGGQPETIASGFYGAFNVTVAGSQAYFAAFTENAVLQLSLEGGIATTLASQSMPTAVLSAGDQLYWQDDVLSASDSGNLMAVSLQGGTPQTLAQNAAWSFAANSTSFFFSDMFGNVESIPLTGGTPVTVLSGVQYGGPLAADDTNLYAFQAAGSSADLLRVPLNGAAAETLAADQYPSFMALGPTSLCWTNVLENPDGTTALATVVCISPP